MNELQVATVRCPMNHSCRRYLALRREIKRAQEVLSTLHRELDDHTMDAHNDDR